MGRRAEYVDESVNAIRALREQKGLTVPALAQQAGISKGYLSRIERGQALNPHPSVLDQIAQALNVSVEQLGFPPVEKPRTSTQNPTITVIVINIFLWEEKE